MTTKLLALGIAVFGLGSFAVSEASAGEAIPAASIVRVNEVDVHINAGPRYRHHYYHRNHYRTRQVYFRHGRRYVRYY